MRSEIAHPCRGCPDWSVRRIRRSTVPWRRSGLDGWPMVSIADTKTISFWCQPSTTMISGMVGRVKPNGGSLSTTCEFLSTLHNHGSATFVGEETAGGYYGNTSGAAASVVLPNSKLILPVQLVGYYLAIEGDAMGAHGIRPDHHVEYSIEDVLAGRDRAMELALRLAGKAPGGK